MTDKRSQKYAIRRYICKANEDNFCEMARPHCDQCSIAKKFEETYELIIHPVSKARKILEKGRRI